MLLYTRRGWFPALEIVTMSMAGCADGAGAGGGAGHCGSWSSAAAGGPLSAQMQI